MVPIATDQISHEVNRWPFLLYNFGKNQSETKISASECHIQDISGNFR